MRRQVDSKAILAVCGTTLVAIDQHAADERVQLERLQAQLLDSSQQEGGSSGRGGSSGGGSQLLQSKALPRPLVGDSSVVGKLVLGLGALGWRSPPSPPVPACCRPKYKPPRLCGYNAPFQPPNPRHRLCT